MKLTAFTDYSLRVLIYLAARPERRATIAEIADSFAVSEHHLTKVVHFLGKHGWLANVRGKGGGLSLARPPDSINVGDVVRHTEANAIVECFEEGGGECRIASLCRLRGVLDEAVAAFYAVLDRYTLADLARNRAALSAIFFVDRAPERRRGKETA
jgi:Rrf2 family nitric oxide-sensitive transcriptional repressor